MIFKIGVFRRTMKIAPIDAPRRELFYSFFRVKNGYELRFLRPYRVGVFFRPTFSENTDRIVSSRANICNVTDSIDPPHQELES